MSHTRLSSALFTKNCPARTKPPPMIELTIDSTAFAITPVPLSEPWRVFATHTGRKQTDCQGRERPDLAQVSAHRRVVGGYTRPPGGPRPHSMSSPWAQPGRAVICWEYRAIVNVAVILVSAGAGAGASIVTAYVTYRLTARQDQRKWRAELAEKYALLAADQPRAAQALARQFAVGVLIIEQGVTALREKVFIAPHTRMTAGRTDDNEIVLPSASASRHHFTI